jgi:hypothetical protein
MTSSEKRVTHTEDEKDGTQFSVASQGPPASVFTEKEQRRIVRRIDWRVVVVLGSVQLISLREPARADDPLGPCMPLRS